MSSSFFSLSLFSIVVVLLDHCGYLTFAKMQLGYHTILALLVNTAVNAFVAVFARSIIANTIAPYEVLVDMVPMILMIEVLVAKKKIPFL